MLSKQVTGHYDATLYQRLTAYRRHHSCQTTLLRLVEDWKSAVDRKELVYILTTDMSKAFDSLCHSLILKKLEAYGFGQNYLNLLRSYFDNRLNRVKIKEVTSDWKRMVLGCPQGSSFGPLLWNLFQNDMSFYINNANLSMYADDHQIYLMGKKHVEVAQSIKTQGEQALSWYKNNYLSANPEKFQLLIINPRNVDTDNDNQHISVDGHVIERIGEIKLLGVQIDDKLDFTSHIRELCTKASQKVGVLVRLRNLIPCNAKLSLYKSSILPHLTYCHLIWHFCNASDRRKLERIQERALRAVYKTRSASYQELLDRAKLPTLYNRRLQDIATLMFKVKHSLVPVNISDLFNLKNTQYNLRNSDFELPRFETIKFGRNSIKYMGPLIWSKLPCHLRMIATLNSFKRNIRKVDISTLVNIQT